MLSLEQLMNACPKHLWLELPAQTWKTHQQQGPKNSNDVARWNAYVNSLCLNALADWLREEPEFQNEAIALFPNPETLPSVWEFLNGGALQLGKTRLVSLPSESVDLGELRVPWEWVDLPQWAADYYLAVQVNLEEEKCWMRVWGFATHSMLKAAKKDRIKRTYILERKDLIESPNALWVGRKLFSPEKPVVEPLPPLGDRAATQLIERLSHPTPYSPRLEVPFEHWAALLVDERWRTELYRRRLKEATEKISGRVEIALRHWLQQAIEAVEAGWQATEELLTSREPHWVRQRGSLDDRETPPEAIAPIVELLQPDRSEQERAQAAGVLGNIGRGHPAAIEALTQLLQTARDEETRWQAALSLGKLDPSHPQAGVRMARLIDLGLQLGEHPVVLIVAIMPQTLERLGVWLQVQPSDPLEKLPPRLKLSIVADGETRLEVEARSDKGDRGKDKSIERRFSPPPGTLFQVKVSLDERSVTQEFVA